MMSFNSPLFDFFDAINSEVDDFNNRFLKDTNYGNKSLIKRNNDKDVKSWIDKIDLIPPIDILEHKESYEIHISVPGIASVDDISLEFHPENGQIVVFGNIPTRQTQENKDGWRIRERACGKFRRVVELPREPGIDLKKTDANYENGVLTLKVGKLEPQQSKNNVIKIPVTSAKKA